MGKSEQEILLEKLEELKSKSKELEEMLSRPEVIFDSSRLKRIAQEHSSLSEMVYSYDKLKKMIKDIEDIKTLLKEVHDDDLRNMAAQELEELKEKKTHLTEHIKDLLYKETEETYSKVILEIRAGTGGEEACLFAADLYRMYSKYASLKNWTVETLSSSPTGMGGLKEMIFSVNGKNCYSFLKYESGVHRVQRVPETETKGRIHTSAVSVAVLPEAEEVEVEVDPEDIRVDIYRSSGAGGQHVNVTDSAVRITHLETGIVVACQDEMSQHKNRAKAMRILRSRLYNHYKEKQDKERAQNRKNQIGSGDRSQKIRTYNFPESRVTDHRIHYTFHRLEEFLYGSLDSVIDRLRQEERKQKLESINE